MRDSMAAFVGLRSAAMSAVALAIGMLFCASSSSAFQVAVSDRDLLRQTCSGMWSGRDTKIELSFDKDSKGTISTLFYEYADFPKIGKQSKQHDIFGFPIKTYICTSQAVLDNVCTQSELGDYIIDGEAPTAMTKRIDLGSDPKASTVTYNVTRKGYYCVGATAVPMTTQSINGDLHSAFTGRINFVNNFNGQLPATEYPKMQFYLTLTLLYTFLGGYWLYLCVQHRDGLLMVQHFVSGTILLLIFGNMVQWLYLRYLNNHAMDFWTISSLDNSSAVTFGARALLVLSSIFDAARNSTSLFLLLIVSMGYGVVRPSIGAVMTRVRILTAVHFICGVLYSIGIVLLVTETGGGWIFVFIFPLAFTLTSFMFWTLHSLNATIEYLGNRKQTFKVQMFRKLHRILVAAVVAIFGFFILTSIAFSQSGSEDFAPNIWPYRWFLLDGWMGTLYLVVFGSIAWLWRPTGHNLRLSMSDEIGQDEGYAGEDFEIGEFGQHGDDDEEDAAERGENKTRPAHESATSTGRPSSTVQGRAQLHGDDTVFELGEEDDDDPATPRRTQHARQGERGSEGERQGLMSEEQGADRRRGSHDTLVAGERVNEKQ